MDFFFFSLLLGFLFSLVFLVGLHRFSFLFLTKHKYKYLPLQILIHQYILNCYFHIFLLILEWFYYTLFFLLYFFLDNEVLFFLVIFIFFKAVQIAVVLTSNFSAMSFNFTCGFSFIYFSNSFQSSFL